MSSSDGVSIREARLDDIEALQKFDPVAQAGDASRGEAISAWVSSELALVAELDAGVVGYVVTVPGHLFDRDFIAMLIVHPEHRRRGIGSALVTAALKGATSQRVFTSTNLSNTPMRELLRSMNWTYSGTLDGLDPGDPELFFYIDR
jgi:ribosomal protein S18 acetylase RimI-like enzyme